VDDARYQELVNFIHSRIKLYKDAYNSERSKENTTGMIHWRAKLEEVEYIGFFIEQQLGFSEPKND
jgi:hypothetical protein